jgi:hypothetical protein
MKKEVNELEDELRPEYDFANMTSLIWQEISEARMLKDIGQEKI